MVDESKQEMPPHFIVVYDPVKKTFQHQVVGDLPFAELALYLDIFILNNQLATIQANAQRQMQQDANKVKPASKILFSGGFP